MTTLSVNICALKVQGVAMSEKQEKIKVRRVQFGHDSTAQRYWFNGNAFATHFLNSLHSVFPDGERLFIRSVRYYEKLIQNPELKERVKGFIGQEVQHGLQHQKFFETLKEQGFDVDVFVQWYKDAAYEKYLEPFFRAIIGSKRLADMGSLSVTAALEHYTATLAEVVLKDPDTFLQGVPDDMKKMLMWHAAEEIEHKSVAYDVYVEQCDNNYPMRMFGFTTATIFFFFFIASGWGWYIANDKEWKWSDLPGNILQAAPVYLNLAWGFIQGAIPYLKPDFHPDQISNTQLAKQFFYLQSQYFAERSA